MATLSVMFRGHDVGFFHLLRQPVWVLPSNHVKLKQINWLNVFITSAALNRNLKGPILNPVKIFILNPRLQCNLAMIIKKKKIPLQISREQHI